MKTVEELFEAIDNLPDTIESIKVPTSLAYFNPPSEEVVPGAGWKQVVKDIISDTLAGDKGEEVDEFKLRSYFGGSGATDPYYIHFGSEGFRRFAKDMGSGKYGALD